MDSHISRQYLGSLWKALLYLDLDSLLAFLPGSGSPPLVSLGGPRGISLWTSSPGPWPSPLFPVWFESN